MASFGTLQTNRWHNGSSKQNTHTRKYVVAPAKYVNKLPAGKHDDYIEYMGAQNSSTVAHSNCRTLKPDR